MGVYASMYETNATNLSQNDLILTPDQLKTQAGTLDNFWNVMTTAAEETFRTNSIIAEQYNEADYWKENDKNFEQFLTTPELKEEYSIYKSLTHKRFTDLKSKLNGGVEGEDLNSEDIKEIKAVRNIEALIETNNQAKIMSRENIQKNVQKDIENLRVERHIKNEQQSNDFAEFVGDTVGFIGDPINLATMFIPVTAGAKGASLLAKSLNVGSKTAGLEMGIETFNQIVSVQPYRKDYLGEDYTTLDAMGAVISTGLGAFVLGAGLKAAGDTADLWLRKGKEKSPNEILADEANKQLTDNPNSFNADQIEAKNQLDATIEKLSLAPDVDADAHLKNFDKASKDLAMGNKVAVEDTMVRKEFSNMIDDVISNKNPKMAKKLLGNELYDYIKKNSNTIKKDLDELNWKDFTSKIDNELANKIKIKDAEVGEALKVDDSQLSKKANNSMIKDDNISQEVVNDLTRAEAEFEAKFDKPDNGDIIENIENYKKADTEQKAMEEFHQCLIGGNNGKTD